MLTKQELRLAARIIRQHADSLKPRFYKDSRLDEIQRLHSIADRIARLRMEDADDERRKT